jgi:hypothetical protein
MMHHLAEMASRVRRAVRTLPQHMDAGEELYIGADGSPTLQIDKVAEDVILGYVNEEHLKWNILSEEAGLIDNSGDRTLVIDPIDGTYNAVMGVPFYSVSLALGTNRLSDIEYGLVQGEGGVHERFADQVQEVLRCRGGVPGLYGTIRHIGGLPGGAAQSSHPFFRVLVA